MRYNPYRHTAVCLILLFISFTATAQTQLSRLERAKIKGQIPIATERVIEANGDSTFFMKYANLDLLTEPDSIYGTDTIRLRDGSGFVKIPKLKAGQTVTVQTAIINDTIYAGVNTNSLDSTHIKAGSVARNDLSFAIDESKWDQASTNLYPKNLSSDVGIGTNNPLSKLHVSNGDLFIIGGSGRRFLLGSSVSTGFWGGMTWNWSNQLEINHSSFFTPIALFTSNGFMGVRTGGTAPTVPLDVFSSSTGDNDTYQKWAYSGGPTSYNLLLKQTVTGGNVRYNFSQVNAGTSYNNVLVFDQGNLGIGVTDATRKVDINGEVRIRDLTTTTPNAIVSTDADGVLSKLTLSGLSISGGALVAPTYTASTGININGSNQISNTGDLSNTNETDVLRVSTSVTGGGRIQNQTDGFAQASEIGLVITGANASVSTGINGNITWTLPDASVSNELQTTGVSSFKLGNYNGGFLFGNGTEFIAGQGLTRDQSSSTNGGSIIFAVGNGAITPAMLDRTYLTSFTEVDGSVTNEGSLTVGAGTGTTSIINSNTSGSTGVTITASTGLSISESGNVITLTNTALGATYTSGTGININGSNVITNTGDLSNTNELDTLTIGGGKLVARSPSGINFAANGVGFIGNTQIGVTPIGNNFNFSINNGSITPTQLDRTYLTSFTESDPTVGAHIKAITTTDISNWNTDLTGPTYTAGTGIAISGGNVISNTGDLSNTNELDTLTIGGGKLVARSPSGINFAANGVGFIGNTQIGVTPIGNNFNFSINNGSITPTQLDRTYLTSFTESDPTVGAHIKAITTTDISNWNTDLTGPTYTAGTGININGSNQISNTGDLSNTNELQTLVWNSGTRVLEIVGGNTVTLPNYLLSEVDGSVTNEGLMSLTTNTSNNYTYNSNTSSSVPLILNAGTNMSFSRTGNEITFNASGGGGGLTGSGTATRVAFWDGTSSLSSNSQLYWDNSNNVLGVGTSSPSSGAKLHISTGDLFIIGGTGRRFLMGSSVSSGFWGGMTWNGSNQLELNHSSFLSPAQIINSSGFTGIRTLGGDPVAPLDVYSESTGDNGGYQRWAYNAAPTSYNLLLKQTVTGGNVRYNFSQVNAGTSYNNVLVFDQGNLGIGVTDATRKVDINGEVRIRDLTTTTPNAIVSTDADGVLSKLTLSGILSISGGALVGTEVDGLTTNEGSLTVGAGTSTTSIINSNTSGSTGVTLSAGSGLSISESGNTITLSAPFQIDGITQQGSLSFSTSNNSNIPLFSGWVASGATPINSTEWVKSSSFWTYEVTIVLSADNNAFFEGTGIEGKFIKIDMTSGGSTISSYKAYNVLDSGDARGDLTFTFLTNNSSGNLAFKNTSGGTLDGVIKRIIIKRVM